MNKLSIVTFTLGNRDYYLDKTIRAVTNASLETVLPIEYFVINQGNKFSSEILDWKTVSSENLKISFIELPHNIGIGSGLNYISPQCNGDLFLKLDDDAKIVTSNFIQHAENIYNKFPESVWSPYPVGLIGNPGGPRGYKHSVWKYKHLIYTRRHVTHVGGFARFCPTKLIQSFKFSNDLIHGISGNEDGQFSTMCSQKGIDMFYLENAMIVEHQDSTYGQIARFPEYFKSRSSESAAVFDIME